MQTLGITALTFRQADLTTTAKKQGLLPVSDATLWRMVKVGKFPAPKHFGASNYWPRQTVEDWMINTLGYDLTGKVVNPDAPGVERKERNPSAKRGGRKPKAVTVAEVATC
jgi:hypothetical protein